MKGGSGSLEERAKILVANVDSLQTFFPKGARKVSECLKRQLSDTFLQNFMAKEDEPQVQHLQAYTEVDSLTYLVLIRYGIRSRILYEDLLVQISLQRKILQ